LTSTIRAGLGASLLQDVVRRVAGVSLTRSGFGRCCFTPSARVSMSPAGVLRGCPGRAVRRAVLAPTCSVRIQRSDVALGV